MCIPAPEVFPQLSTFLYTKRIDHLLATLLPQPAPAALYTDLTSESVRTQMQQFATKLAALTPAHVLLPHAMAVNGFWRNACALGIADEKLSCAMDIAWEVHPGIDANPSSEVFFSFFYLHRQRLIESADE